VGTSTPSRFRLPRLKILIVKIQEYLGSGLSLLSLLAARKLAVVLAVKKEPCAVTFTSDWYVVTTDSISSPTWNNTKARED